MTRRQFNMALGATAVTASALPAVGRAETPDALIAQPGLARLAPADYPETRIWGYGGTAPGPVIHVPQGGRLVRRFVNDLPQPATVHWHGIRLANAMDGVEGLTQAPVEPGADFLYDLTAPDAGTYWYHPHRRSWEQLARGLSGVLIVDEAEGAPEVDRDEPLQISDWRLTQDAQIAEGFDDLHDRAHGGRIGNWITVNGTPDYRGTAHRNERLRLRVVNASSSRIMVLEASGFDGWVVALDGMPLEAVEPLGRIILAPAQRADLIVDVIADQGEDAYLAMLDRDGGYQIAAWSVDESARSERLPAPEALPANPVAALGPLDTARTADLRMEGGAMGSLSGAIMNGQMTSMRDMAAAGRVWAFNGMAQMSETPLIEVARGETVRLAIANDTSWPHAMHLHGHHFRQVLAEGTLGPLRDTLLMDRGATADIAFVADNPGDWLLHCHMLEHAAGGMMTWLRVT